MESLRASSERLCTAMKHALKSDVHLRPGQWVQIELDPWDFRIVFCPTEFELLNGNDWREPILDEWPPGEEFTADAIMEELVFPWIADAWVLADGPMRFSPAYAFWHDSVKRYDLEGRVWLHPEKCRGPKQGS